MTKYTVSDLILDFVRSLGTEFVFGVPGGAAEPFFNALDAHGKKENGMKVVLTRAESGAAFAAHGYYKESGNIGFCISTSGPGATNLISGVASAFHEQVPMIVITGNCGTSKFGKNALQDSSDSGLNVVSMYSSITKYSSAITHPDQTYSKLITAVAKALEHPRGPIHLNIPSDILAAELTSTYNFPTMKLLTASSLAQVDSNLIEQAAVMINKSNRPLLILGDRTEDDAKAIMNFINSSNIPVVLTSGGREWFPWSHKQFQGIYGFGGHESATTAIEYADTLIITGSSMRELCTNGWSKDLFDKNIIIIDNQQNGLNHLSEGDLSLIGDISSAFSNLKVKPIRSDTDYLFSFASLPKNEKQTHPARLMNFIHNRLPNNTHLYIDAGNSWAWSLHYLPISEKISKIRMGMGLGCMAWAIGASIGAQVANRNQPIACMTGDGAWMMSSFELSTAIAENLPIIFIILNDSSLGMVRHGQKLSGAANIANQLPRADFASVANAMGATGLVVENAEKLFEMDFSKLDSKKPIVLDVHIDAEAIPPMKSRVTSLKKNLSMTPGH